MCLLGMGSIIMDELYRREQQHYSRPEPVLTKGKPCASGRYLRYAGKENKRY